MTDDEIEQLRHRIEELEKIVATMQSSGPKLFKDVFVADVEDDGTWAESIPDTDGTTIAFNDGRAGSDADYKAIELSDASVLLQVEYQNKCRFVKVGGTASLPTGQYQYMQLTVVASNVTGWDWDRAHPTLE